MSEYQAGSCNIGPAEIRQRQVIALVGAVITVISFIGLISADAPRSARLSLFIPLLVTSVGWVQSRKKFCLAYGFMGTFNLGHLGKISRVASPEDRARDRKTALAILGQSLAVALVATIIAVGLPL